MKLYVFDDAVADGWAPFALTRPVGELRFGRWLLRERAEQAADLAAEALVVGRPWLATFREEGAPPVRLPEDVSTGEDRLLWCARAVPLGRIPRPEEPAVLVARGEAVGAFLPAGREAPEASWWRRPAELPGARVVEVEAELLGGPWELVSRGGARLERDLVALASEEGPAPELPAGVHRLGGAPLRFGPGVRVEPGVLLDTRRGPIHLDRGVEVRAGARLEGPLYAGPGSRLLGGPLATLSAGPLSYLHGEVEEVTVLGHTNKAHAGYLGHAFLGRWVNLGALTTNSDLKNNYSNVRVGPPDRQVDTGLLKFGCLVGDHVKTGIGLLLNTGSVIGAGSNLFGPAMPPKWTPPFSWGSGEALEIHRREAFLGTASAAMARRGVEADEAVRRWLAAVWDAGRATEGDG